MPGGNAESWDYEQSLTLKTNSPVILAGGLNAENVNQAVKDVCPAAVDVSSGVEKAPGIKSLKKIVTFINQLKFEIKDH